MPVSYLLPLLSAQITLAACPPDTSSPSPGVHRHTGLSFQGMKLPDTCCFPALGPTGPRIREAEPQARKRKLEKETSSKKIEA